MTVDDQLLIPELTLQAIVSVSLGRSLDTS